MPLFLSQTGDRGHVVRGRLAILFIPWLVTIACGESSAEPRPATAGDVYLEAALDTLQAHYVYRAQVDWPGLRQEVHDEAGNVRTTQDAHPVIRRALELIGAKHSSLIESEVAGDTTYVDSPPLIRLAENFPGSTARIGYVRVEQAVGMRIDDLATQYQRGIERVDATGTCGWIVDLRNNPGGSMWPMVAGLGPLLGEGTLGYFVYPDSNEESWSYEGGASRKDGEPYAQVENPYVLRDPEAPVAVLVNQYTASSAEATFVSFVGRPNTRSIGYRTAGYSTYNHAWQLSDGAVLLVTVALMADRTKTTYGDAIWPDTIVGGAAGIDPILHTPYGAALTWLGQQPACTGD